MIEAIFDGPIFSASVLEEKYLPGHLIVRREGSGGPPGGTFRTWFVSFSPVAVSMVSGRILTDSLLLRHGVVFYHSQRHSSAASGAGCSCQCAGGEARASCAGPSRWRALLGGVRRHSCAQSGSTRVVRSERQDSSLELRACLLILLNRSARRAASSWRFEVSPAASLERKRQQKAALSASEQLYFSASDQ